MAPKRRIESNGQRGPSTASHWLQTTAASATTVTARKLTPVRIANGFALAANDRSQRRHSHGAQALATRQSVSARAKACAFTRTRTEFLCMRVGWGRGISKRFCRLIRARAWVHVVNLPSHGEIPLIDDHTVEA
jgi:hypothetical protein